jgi:two-component system response regulator AtoC
MRGRLQQTSYVGTARIVLAISGNAPSPSMVAAARGYELEWVRNAGDALTLLSRDGIAHIEFVLLDGAVSELHDIQELRRRFPTLPIIASPREGGELALVDCDPGQPESVVEEETDPACPDFYMGGGWSRRVRVLLAQVAASDAPVLLHGETGSGKEIIARFLHAHSSRSHLPLLKVNCAALPSELVESELFGYERGAFTGAFARKPGKFELAEGGAILLDEIGDMEFRLQAKLLQVLQDRTFDRLGGKQARQVDVRIMAATHCDLEAAVREHRFRQDLYYRLNVVTIRVPALRERRDEILPLCEFFLRKHAEPGAPPMALPKSLEEAFLCYDWPGNVRELENLIRRLLILRDPGLIEREMRVHQLAARPASQPAVRSSLEAPPALDGGTVLKQLENVNRRAAADAILAALNAARWNRRQAAAYLGIGYKALLYRMRKLGIDKTDTVAPASPQSREFAAVAGDNFPKVGNATEGRQTATGKRAQVVSVGAAELQAGQASAPKFRPDTCISPRREVPTGTERA